MYVLPRKYLSSRANTRMVGIEYRAIVRQFMFDFRKGKRTVMCENFLIGNISNEGTDRHPRGGGLLEEMYMF